MLKRFKELLCMFLVVKQICDENHEGTTIEGEVRLGGPGYVEGTAWQYAFFVPHDVPGLIALHGEDAFVDRLQWVFDTDRFVMWNEPDMHYPYLFTFIDG